jgi:photosynthetic reaction center cytochrome c subunit
MNGCDVREVETKIQAPVKFGLPRMSRWNRIVPCALMAAGGCLLCAFLGRGQAGRSSPSAVGHVVLMSDQVHKNLKLLKRIPEDEFMDTMGFFSAALGVGCEFCHGPDSIGNWAGFAGETPMKETARKMMRMVAEINKKNFAGQRLLTCYSCHNGGERPKLIPTLDGIYDPPPLPQPDVITRGLASPSADQILDKYLQALGGAQRLAALTSFVAKGTVQEVGAPDTNPVEVYAQAPAQLSTIVRTMTGVTTTVCDGNAVWIAAPYEDEPVPLLPLSGGALDGAKLDAQLNFPAHIKKLLTGWRVGYPYSIADTETQVVQGFSAAGSPVKLYFDQQSGLLVRQIRYTSTAAGALPIQVDYSDYREVAAVKIPFRVMTTWADGRTLTQLTEVQPNVPIDSAKFGQPAPAPRSKAAER